MIENYDLELDKLFMEIRRSKAEMVLIQLPDGLKKYALEIEEVIKKEFPDIVVFFWSGSCFGACDAPLGVQNLGFDLLVQFGHSPWRV